MDLLATAPASAALLLRSEQTPELLPFLLAVAPIRSRGTLQGVVLAYRPDPYGAPKALACQEVALCSRVDARGRSRTRFVCAGCDRPVDVLYLVPQGEEFCCHRCAAVSHRLGPPPSAPGTQGWRERLEGFHQDGHALARAAAPYLYHRRPLAARGGEHMEASRREGSHALRRHAVAALWRDCGWKAEELAQLFGVSGRTIKRDLRRARERGEVPPRRERAPLAELRGQLRQLRERARALQDRLSEMEASPRISEGQRVWLACSEARLIAEERLLAELAAGLEGWRPPRRRKPGLKREPEWLDPELLALARTRAGERQATGETHGT